MKHLIHQLLLCLPMFAVTTSMAQIIAIKQLPTQQQQETKARGELASYIKTIPAASQPATSALPIQRILPLQTWAIEPTDVRLVDTFTRWAKKAGIQLRWDAMRHVELGAIDVYDGDIQTAIISALSSPSIANSDHPLEVCFYANRPVLARVTRRGEQWRDCPLIQAPTAIDAIQK